MALTQVRASSGWQACPGFVKRLGSLAQKSSSKPHTVAMFSTMQLPRLCLLLLLGCSLGPKLAFGASSVPDITPTLSVERVVFQLETGDFEFGFYPEVAPVTSAHIFKLVQLGLYTTNHIFRVDKGFVAQIADVSYSRTIALNAQQKEHAYTKVPLEVKEGVRHHEGVISMGRYDDPNSGTSSFSILLGTASHLDMQYTLFGKVVNGMDVIHALESLPTKTEGIFVMPLKRITIVNSYWYRVGRPFQNVHLPGARRSSVLTTTTSTATTSSGATCEQELAALKERFAAVSTEVQELRKKLLP